MGFAAYGKVFIGRSGGTGESGTGNVGPFVVKPGDTRRDPKKSSLKVRGQGLIPRNTSSDGSGSPWKSPRPNEIRHKNFRRYDLAFPKLLISTSLQEVDDRAYRFDSALNQAGKNDFPWDELLRWKK